MLGSLTYPEDTLTRLGQMKGMQFGRKHFFAHEVWTLPNGELLFESTRDDLPTSEDKRPGTASLPSRHHTTPPPMNRLAPMRPAQPGSNTANVMSKTETSGETVKENPGYPNTTHLDTTTSHRLPEELHLDHVAAGAIWCVPSFTPNTYILIRNADKASWIQLGDATSGATVVQSLPSGNIGDLSGAKSTTIERVCQFRSRDGTDIVQIGKAFIIADHLIQTVDGWMTAHQAADTGHGTILSDRMHSSFYSLHLVAGGNIIINTSASPDQPPTQIEAATMGNRFVPSANLPNKNSPTCFLQEAGLRDGLAAQAKPSYSQVTQLSLQGLSSRSTSQSTPLAPKINAQPESKAVIERDVKGHRGELKVGARCLSATTHLILGQCSDYRANMAAISIQL